MSGLDEQQKELLSDKIKKIESQTDGEIVMVISPCSDHYLFHCFTYAAGFSLLSPLLFSYWWSLGADVFSYFNVQIIAFCLLYLFFSWWPIRRKLVSNKVMHTRAKRMAHELFFMQKLHHKTQRNAIMLFVSEAERYVEILVDRDMSDKVSEQTWKAIVDEFIALVRAGKTVQGYEQAIEQCGALLIEHFQLSKESKDELPNHLIEWQWQDKSI